MVEYMGRQGYDPVYGARPLKRFLQRELETKIGRELIGGNIADGAAVFVELRDRQLTLHADVEGQAARSDQGASL